MKSVAKRGLWAMWASVLGMAVLASGGCSPDKAFTALQVKVQSGPGLAQGGRMPTVRVEFVGLTQDEGQAIGMPNPRQWFAGSRARTRLANAGMLAERKISSEGASQSLEASDPIWKAWREANVRHVLIIADPPLSVADADVADWVRKIEPESKTWVNNQVTATIDNGLAVGTRVPETSK